MCCRFWRRLSFMIRKIDEVNDAEMMILDRDGDDDMNETDIHQRTHQRTRIRKFIRKFHSEILFEFNHE